MMVLNTSSATARYHFNCPHIPLPLTHLSSAQHAHGSIIHIAPVPAELDNATIGLVAVTDKGDIL
jgi:hypothetical protein